MKIGVWNISLKELIQYQGYNQNEDAIISLKYILKGIDTIYGWGTVEVLNPGLKYILKGIDTHSLKPGNQSLDIVWNISLKELILKWRFRL